MPLKPYGTVEEAKLAGCVFTPNIDNSFWWCDDPESECVETGTTPSAALSRVNYYRTRCYDCDHPAEAEGGQKEQ